MPFRTPDLDHPLYAPFWRGAPDGMVNLPRCEACATVLWPPTEICPECLGSDIGWHAMAGDGTVWGLAEYHRAYAPSLADVVPYRCVLVDLDCGARLVARLVDSDVAASTEPGSRVRVVRVAVPDQPDGIACFAIAQSAASAESSSR